MHSFNEELLIEETAADDKTEGEWGWISGACLLNVRVAGVQPTYLENEWARLEHSIISWLECVVLVTESLIFRVTLTHSQILVKSDDPSLKSQSSLPTNENLTKAD
eukprot:TCALIF_03456-PA protein Name:"Protein of unknown function" AED:0.25 eAED:0.32 QI:148/0/0.5/1/1/1/2/0/105